MNETVIANIHRLLSLKPTGGNRTTHNMNKNNSSDISNFNHAEVSNDDAQTTTSTMTNSHNHDLTGDRFSDRLEALELVWVSLLLNPDDPNSKLKAEEELLSHLKGLGNEDSVLDRAWDTIALHTYRTAVGLPLPEQSRDEWLKVHEEALRWHDSYAVLDYLLALYGAEPQRRQWWFQLFGRWWTCCYGMDAYRKVVKNVFKKVTRQNLDDMMDEAEAKRFADLPETIRVYRGCQKGDTTGFSFTLSRDVATKFPFYSRYRAKTPVLITADVQKKYAVLKMDRNEDEIIACGPVSVISTELITLTASEVFAPALAINSANPDFQVSPAA